MMTISIKNLVKRFGDRVAVDGLSLDIEQGELVALLGMNGAGKTTTINILSGLLGADEGDAFIFGKSGEVRGRTHRYCRKPAGTTRTVEKPCNEIRP